MIKNLPNFLIKLENTIAVSHSKDLIVWKDELQSTFAKAKRDLSTHKDIALSRPGDHL